MHKNYVHSKQVLCYTETLFIAMKVTQKILKIKKNMNLCRKRFIGTKKKQKSQH